MQVLVLGGTGLISVGIVNHLLARGAEVTLFNRGQRENAFGHRVRVLTGDRNEFDVFERRFAGERFDAVIDMICFSPQQAISAVRAFRGRCEQFIFCSTVCVYGGDIPPGVVVDESFARNPVSDYGRNKKTCEDAFLDAHARGDFAATVIRPSHTYGEGSPLIDQLEFNTVAWDRIERGLPVICAGDGLGLWNSTHRDDVGKLFAYACGNARTYGQSYNATTQRVFTWRDYYREAAGALGRKAQFLSMPADWIVAHDRPRFGLLHEITRYHGAYTSAKAMTDVPEFRCEVDFAAGAKRVLDDLKRRGAWKSSDGDTTYQSMIERALASGVQAVEL